MIVLSDEEDDVEEIIPVEKMGKVSSSKGKGKASGSDDSDDVCVVDEVPKYYKYPRGMVFAPPRLRDPCGLHISNIRRRKGFGTTIKYGTIRRSISSSTFRLCSSGVRRKLFGVSEAVRLDEMSKYKELIQSFIGCEMIAISYVLAKFLSFFAPNICRTLINSQPHRVPQPIQSSKTSTRLALRTRPSTVECVDLDSDNDVVEVPQVSKTTKEDVQMKNDEGIEESDDIIELEQETEDPCSSLQTWSEQQSLEIDCEASTSSTQPETISDEDETFINLADDEEEGKEEDLYDVTEVLSPPENKPKGNLSDQMVQQMIINDDDSHVPVERRSSDNEEEEEAIDEDIEESLPEITVPMQVLVRRAFTCRRAKVLVGAFNLTVLGKDIQTLMGDSWLNDQVINFYMSLLMERGKLGSYPTVYCFNTFFFVRLVSAGHASVKRWTKKVDLFSYDMLIIPVHLKVHWCLATVNFIEKRIEFYDSMRDNNRESDCGQALLKYLQDEHLDKKKETFCTEGWEIVNLKDIPEQLNGCDCGVFACTYAEYICRLAKLTFSQEDMPYFRVKMAYEIITKKLLL